MARYRVTGHAIIEAENESEAAEVAGHSETMWQVGAITKLGPLAPKLTIGALIASMWLPGGRVWATLLG